MKMNPMNQLILYSPWPIMLSTNFFCMVMNLTMNMKSMTMMYNLTIMMFMMITSVILWLNNSMNEKSLISMKSNYNEMSMKMTIYLIMLTEMMFFITFFYINYSFKYFNNSLFNMKYNLNLFKLSLLMSFLNLMILLTSSITLMEALNMNNKNSNKFNTMTKITAYLGVYFLMIQIFEYSTLNFNMSNSIFFSNFFMLTMFHMTHVMMGVMLMMYMLLIKNTLLLSNKTKLKMLCWYWHFVDTIWIFIFITIYL